MTKIDNKPALTRFCRLVLSLTPDTPITENEVKKTKIIIEDKIHNGMSPREIRDEYGIKYTDFGMFLKKAFGIKLKTLLAARHNYIEKSGRGVTDAKKIYKKACAFKFDPYTIPSLHGFDLIKTHGFYHPLKNPNGVSRDHIISIEYGWRNGVDPSIISHPANCQYLPHVLNSRKNSACGMALDDLITLIANWDTSRVQKINKQYCHLPKTAEHNLKISKTNSTYMSITNGEENLRVKKDTEIPEGYWRGMTRNNKKRKSEK